MLWQLGFYSFIEDFSELFYTQFLVLFVRVIGIYAFVSIVILHQNELLLDESPKRVKLEKLYFVMIKSLYYFLHAL